MHRPSRALSSWISSHAFRLWRRPLRVAVLLALATALGCEEQAGPGEQGFFRVTLVSPNGAEGAALFEMPIDGIVSLRAPVGTVVGSESDGRRWVALFVSQPGELVLEVGVADRRKPPEVRLHQVSGPNDQARVLTGYRVEVEPK
jgi:hypothetical protein